MEIEKETEGYIYPVNTFRLVNTNYIGILLKYNFVRNIYYFYQRNVKPPFFDRNNICYAQNYTLVKYQYNWY